MENQGSQQNHHGDPLAMLAEMKREMEAMKKKSEEDMNALQEENEKLKKKVKREERERSREGSTKQEGSRKESRSEAL